MASKRGRSGGNAQTLRDYWSGHGHAGPSHGVERDAIAWGTSGDFSRCVAQVSEHMSPEDAKGYCNLRHKDALGFYPAQHAEMERGKMASFGDHLPGGENINGINGLLLVDEYKDWTAWDQQHGGTGKPGSSSAADASSAVQHARQTIADHKAGKPVSAADLKNAHLVHAAHLAHEKELAGKKPKATAKKGARNPRNPIGQFRTFEGELQEAKQALAEGRVSDVVELLGSARALATTPEQRLVLGELQGAMAHTQHVVPEVTKVGPKGYSHGWVKGDTVTDTRTGRTAIHDGTTKKGHIQLRTPGGDTWTAPKESVRSATPDENSAMLAAGK
jgi:hypothetical protein